MERIPPSATGRDVLRDAQSLVIKIGGENATELGLNFLGARERIARGQSVTHVVSALRGGRNGGFNTTSNLIDIAHALERNDTDEALRIMRAIETWTRQAVQADLASDASLSDPERVDLFAYLCGEVQRHVQRLRLHIHSHEHGILTSLGQDWVLRNGEHFSITGWGERLAQGLHYRTSEWRGQAAATLDLEQATFALAGNHPEFLLHDPAIHSQCVDVLREHACQHLVAHHRAGYRFIVAPGHFTPLATERGYSDTGAALVAQAQQRLHDSVACLIRKQHPVCTSDPARGSAEVIRRLSFEQAAPMVEKGGIAAGVIHPQALRMLASSRIPIVVCSPDDEETDRTTLIADGT